MFRIEFTVVLSLHDAVIKDKFSRRPTVFKVFNLITKIC